MKTIRIKRSQAAGMIEDLRRLLVTLPGEEPLDAEGVQGLMLMWGIPPLEACGGEAHDNPHIDNCLACAPRWGVVGPRVVVT